MIQFLILEMIKSFTSWILPRAAQGTFRITCWAAGWMCDRAARGKITTWQHTAISSHIILSNNIQHHDVHQVVLANQNNQLLIPLSATV